MVAGNNIDHCILALFTVNSNRKFISANHIFKSDTIQFVAFFLFNILGLFFFFPFKCVWKYKFNYICVLKVFNL